MEENKRTGDSRVQAIDISIDSDWSWLRERHLICLWHCALECIAASMDIRGAETLGRTQDSRPHLALDLSDRYLPGPTIPDLLDRQAGRTDTGI